MDYEVRSPIVEDLLKELGQGLREVIPKGWGFTLMIFSYGKTGLIDEGPEGSMFYISSAQRTDMIKAMKEFIAKEEAK